MMASGRTFSNIGFEHVNVAFGIHACDDDGRQVGPLRLLAE
jgi:hypothetical protein